MIEPAMEMLCNSIKEQPGKILLIADEQLDCNSLLTLKALPNLTLVSNRYDLIAAAEQNNIHCYFNDMELSACAETFDIIGYRISKEKAVVHHVINQAPQYLNGDGQLLLCGFKNEGIKTYSTKTEAFFGCKASVSKGPRQLKLASFKPQSLDQPLDDKHYTSTINIAQADFPILSKPGQFGWNKIDEGSELLIHQFKTFLETTTEQPSSLLDLGSGYGYLSLQAWKLGQKHIVATDNNAAAINSCRQNFKLHSIAGEVIADDCAASITDKFDVVLCNPPFHKGFDTEKELTEKFVKSAKQRLTKIGSALFVVNQFIPLEQVAATIFSSVETVFNNNRFKVIKLSS